MDTMKCLMTGIIAFCSISASAQVTSDSINSLKQQKQSLEISARINDRKLQLAKLENNLDKRTRDVENTALDAQKAADENADAAAKLSADPQDKTLAKRARKAANAAEKSAKKARNASDDLAGLKKDIESLKNKIADDESKLGGMPAVIPQNQ
jgi:chromosome segregation ATPase